MMTKAIPRIGAMAAAACLVASMALPAQAAIRTEGADSAAEVQLQTLAISSAESADIVRDGFAVTAAPRVIQPATVNRSATITASAQAYSGAAVLEYASQFVGVVPYGMGNTPATSFSCDGFTQYVFAGFGISLPRGADHQAALGVRISQADAVAGDLVWWPGQHIGIYDGAGGMYDSPNWGRYVQHASLWGSPVFIRLY